MENERSGRTNQANNICIFIIWYLNNRNMIL